MDKDILIKTKLFIPPFMEDMVSRATLIEKINLGDEKQN